MDKYEISLWEDYQLPGESFFRERKIAVIGSDTMKAQARALEPNLVEEINGSNTFTFKMFYIYTDNQTGEKYSNPFAKYLVNERKVKVFWKDKWYDFVIKKCQEDSSKKSVTYTCKDLFINELSKQGYSLEFNTELENNIGTAAELAKQVLDGSTWQYDDNASTPIIQRTEGPVYECTTQVAVSAIVQVRGGDAEIEIPAGKLILVFYDSLVNLLNITENTTAAIQFLYSPDGYITDINDMVVINGDCCEGTFVFSKEDNILTASIGNTTVFIIDLAAGVSNQYTAKRLVKSQKSVYDALLDRYVWVCKDKDTHELVYQIKETEYTNPIAVVNLISNPTNYTGTSGWIGQVDKFGIFPKFTADTEIKDYINVKSYLKIKGGWTYNTGLQSNVAYFTPNESEIRLGVLGGIAKDEKFIFRTKVHASGEDAPDLSNTKLLDAYNIIPNVYHYDENYGHKGDPLFSQTKTEANGEWIEYTLVALENVSANEIATWGFFLNINQDLWFEDIQFFKYAEGITSYDKDAQIGRINPNEVNLQSIAVPVYKYYKPNSKISDVNDLTPLYVGKNESDQYLPVYNNYEKIGTITERESNRFNILQSIAETFQAWVRFRIDHEEDGSIKIIDNKPQKYVYFTEELEHDIGLCFEYGIDLKTISRTIDSDKLATKIIVNPNNNEFAQDGFCSIARTNENYCKENFILNLDYFVQQNLLDGESLNKDLYSTEGIGYYYWLHQYNNEYDELSDELVVKKLDLLRQTSQKLVYNQYVLAATQQSEEIENDLISLAGVSEWNEVESYAQSHYNNTKVQSLLNAYAKTRAEIESYKQLLQNYDSSISLLTNRIDEIVSRQEDLIKLIKRKHQQFNDKYTTYIMEGTWQNDEYVDDTKYYLDGIKVAYTSSRPQLSYDINVLRLSRIEEFSSKVFNLGDICYIQDREFFGYLRDGFTPYKEKILVSKVSTFLDQPERDVLTVQNYKTRFDDLFQRIAASSQSLQYAEGSYQRAADGITSDGTIDSSLMQSTFDQNQNLVLTSSNQNVVWDDTGITVTDKTDTANKTKILAGGIFVSDDGGVTWKNAIRGDGISTNLLTAGRIDTNEIYIYDANSPKFRWDSYGITAYSIDDGAEVKFNKFVRFDKYGIYGYDGGANESDFVPVNIQQVKENADFGLTWSGFFLKNKNSNSIFEISTENDLIITNNGQKRIQIGRLSDYDNHYGMVVSNNGGDVFVVDATTEYVKLAGWTVDINKLYYENKDDQGNIIASTYLNADGTINASYTVQGQLITKNIVQPQIVSTDEQGMATLSSGTFNYEGVGNGSIIKIKVNSISEDVVCIASKVDVIAQTTSTSPIVSLKIGTDECYSTADSSFDLEVTQQVQQPDSYGQWSIGQGIIINDNNAQIAIGDTEIDTTGIQTKDLVVSGDLYYHGTIINPIDLNEVYPVGSIYMSVNNVDPGTLFGGTWEQLKDRFLLGAGDNYTAGDTGGEATHTLTVDEMPSHNHTVSRGTNTGTTEWGLVRYSTQNSSADTTRIANTGGDQPHNNMPPYLVVYMWKRTA